MKDLISHKRLTKLPNREKIERILTKALRKKRGKAPAALLFIDLDNFRNINHMLGYQLGDKLLEQVADRLRVFFARQNCYLGYFGSDEFIVLLTDLQKESDAKNCAKELLDLFSDLFKIDKLELHVSVSIGVAISSEAITDSDTLIKNADIARYHAKEIGRNGFQIYTESMGIAYQRRLKLQTDLYFAIEKKLFYLLYQPQYELPAKKIRGVEALLRWQHPELGVIEPDDFIFIAEKTGLIVSLGNWVIREACSQYRRWESEVSMKDVKLSINISPYQLIKGKFVEDLVQILHETGISPEVLELEITETALMTELKGSEDVLRELRDKGFTISIDDFGSGYSSLTRIDELPIHILKIDKSFVSKMIANRNESLIVQSILEMAEALGLVVIAEGTERKEEVQFLVNHGCRFVQGHYFSKPITADEITKLLA